MSTLTAAEHRRQAESYLDAAEQLRRRDPVESLALSMIAAGHAILSTRMRVAVGVTCRCPSCDQLVVIPESGLCPACGANAVPF